MQPLTLDPAASGRRRHRSVTAADERLLRDLESGDLRAGTFHHPQHVRVAWTLLHQQDLHGSLHRFGAALQRFARRNGVPELYHETITWLFLFLIHERICELGEEHTWEELARRSPDLLEDHGRLLTRYYSEERLASPLARASFLLPDRCSLASSRSAEGA